jgi:hypothetical protein
MLDMDLAVLYGVANCDHLQNLTDSPEPGRRPIGFLTHEDNKTPKDSRLTQGRPREHSTKNPTSLPFMTMATHLSHVARFADASLVAAIVSTLSRQSIWRHFVNLLQMHKDGITVADYWTELPPKAKLEKHLQQALIEARERLARVGIKASGKDPADRLICSRTSRSFDPSE